MTTNEILRLVTIASSVAGIVVMVLVAYRWRNRWLYTVAPLIYLASALALSMAGLFIPLPVSQETAVILNTASYIIRLQSIFVLIGAGGLFLWRPKS